MTILKIILALFIWDVFKTIVHDHTSKWLKKNEHLKSKKTFDERIEELKNKDQ